ncbi:MAG: T9SS type A sorting domain-containing protein [Flavobacteriaceae bacterium]|nr:T9SS type A sorting domain-containing protein [Flavobacteriaceae bacterium]NNK73837.1 T9SS type A sorting domain-containing protein [Flavobacteriaceae bacterium]
MTENTTYAFYVIANDAAGNSSPQSNTVNETTLAAPTCSDGIQNGDETGVDCGGSFCPPCSDVTLNQGFFETGWDGWIDGGGDCARVASTNSWEGSYSIRLRDNSGVSSSMTLNNIDASPYSQVEVDFYFYVNSMENGEDFWLRFFDGSSWTTVATWISGSGIANGNFYNATVPLTSAQYNFAVNSGFRFQCDASGNNDQIYIDQVTITGTNSAKGGEDSLVLVGSMTGFTDDLEDFKLYPVPVKGDVLFAELPEHSIFDYVIKNLVGQIVLKGQSEGTINVRSLKSGLYIIEVNDGDEVMTKRFIRQ